jgi:cytochrome P450
MLKDPLFENNDE